MTFEDAEEELLGKGGSEPEYQYLLSWQDGRYKARLGIFLTIEEFGLLKDQIEQGQALDAKEKGD